MPLYSYTCPVHGSFDVIQTLGDSTAICPRCKRSGRRVVTAPARITVNYKQTLPYGTGSRGRYLSSKETGGLPVLIPSWGAMEQAEVDYVAEAAIDKERGRKKRQRVMQDKVAAYSALAYQTKPGQRAKVLQGTMREYGDLKEDRR